MESVGIDANQESTLLEAGFEPLEDEGMLWEKNGVCYGRQAALQEALRKLRAEGGVLPFDRT
jgi:hypothetical protein